MNQKPTFDLPEDGLLLAQHDPAAFRTRQIKVQVERGRLNWQPVGPEINFAQMQALRAQGCPTPADVDNFQRTVANLGVSVRLEVLINGERYLLLVPQQLDNGEALKLVSGYVASEQLDNPLATQLEEISQELLLFDHNSCVYRFSYQGQPLATPYALNYGDTLELLGSAKPQQWYLHPQSNSLQLVWHFTLELSAKPACALYTEEQLVASRHRLETRLNLKHRIHWLSLDKPPATTPTLSEYFDHFRLQASRYGSS